MFTISHRQSMNVAIIECRISCGCCGTPLLPSHEKERGLRINRVASLGSEIVWLRDRRQKAKGTQIGALTRRINETLAEIVELGGEMDSQGFIRFVD